MKEKRDGHFAHFIRKLGEATKTVVVPDSAMQKWRGVLPDKLLRYWEVEGWNTYHNGLFSIVDPDDYEDIIDAWLEDTVFEERDSYHVMARSGFGTLYTCGEKSGENLIVDCYNHSIYFAKDNAFVKTMEKLDSDINAFFAMASVDYFDIKNGDDEYLFDQAINKYGSLNDDEIFGFEPALILGGVEDVEHITKVNAQVHLMLLREFGEPTIYEL